MWFKWSIYCLKKPKSLAQFRQIELSKTFEVIPGLNYLCRYVVGDDCVWRTLLWGFEIFTTYKHTYCWCFSWKSATSEHYVETTHQTVAL